MKYLVVILLPILSITSCSKQNVIMTECTAETISEYNLTSYSGESLGCKFYLELYEYDHKQFFYYTSKCADIVTYPTDCNGRQICVNYDSECRKFQKFAQSKGIVGIEQ